MRLYRRQVDQQLPSIQVARQITNENGRRNFLAVQARCASCEAPWL